MVSFMCEGCSDVVKKPKLDKHGSMCHSAFTCIDCSKTFQGPAQWKSHTSCITEAEKYQGNLYKGPKGEQNGGPRSNGNARNGGRNANAPAGKYQQWSYNGGFQGGRPTWGKPYTRNEATGANITPLGTPLRMSPVPTTPVSLPDSSSSNTPLDASASKAPSKPTAPKVEEKSTKDKKSKKDKKRKASDEEATANDKDSEEPRTKKAKTVSEPLVSQAAEVLDSSKPAKKHKKSKKDKREEAPASDEVRPEVTTEPVSGELVRDEGKRKKEKKEKKSKGAEGKVNADEVAVNVAQVVEAVIDTPIVQAGELEVREKKDKKDKKSKKDRKEKEKKNKKSKSEVEVS